MMIQVQVEKISFYPPSKGYAVLLKEAMGSRFLPVIVGSFEAQSIALALEEVQMPRPMTHDLFCNILDELDVEIGEVVISELAEGTFFSKISLESQLGTREIDARPSDAIALALRVGAPIYVSESVMDEASVSELANKDVGQEEKPAGIDTPSKPDSLPPHEYLKKLEDQLDRAVDSEEYEKAAELRDKIKKFHTQTSS
ncbi:MAG: bifunctional nuclease family protein [Candidatus Marinimicrobia bacterium]|nr:bifunctional nuclease family protein [Candidatus Neomarinimicrobiota bacterium]